MAALSKYRPLWAAWVLAAVLLVGATTLLTLRLFGGDSEIDRPFADGPPAPLYKPTADELNLSEDRAEPLRALMNEANASLIPAIWAVAGEELLGVSFTQEPFLRLVVRLEKDARSIEEVRKLAKASDVPVDLVLGVQLTFSELHAGQMQIVSAAFDLLEGGTIGVDQKARVVRVDVPPHCRSDSQMASIEAQVRSLTDMPIRFVIGWDPGDPPFTCGHDLSEWPLALVPSSGGFNDARTEGELILEGGCILLARGDSRQLLVFPYPGTIWDAETQSILEEITGRRAYIGDYMAFGGSGFDLSSALAWSNPPSPECDATGAWYGYIGGIVE
jgi:hypothetical protein